MVNQESELGYYYTFSNLYEKVEKYRGWGIKVHSIYFLPVE